MIYLESNFLVASIILSKVLISSCVLDGPDGMIDALHHMTEQNPDEQTVKKAACWTRRVDLV